MALELKTAKRQKVKLRLNLSAPSGAGKTYSALLMAFGMTNDWSKIAVIDSENGSASLYSHLGGFQTIGIEAPFSPERYIERIELCERSGMEVIIIDSTTHEWSGAGGCIEINDANAMQYFNGNNWAAWSKTNPRHDAFVNKVLQSSCHIITCTRSKTETVQEGKKVIKLGMKDQQRDGWEYELTVSLHIERESHKANASKDRTELFTNRDPFLITPEIGKEILKWCNDGVEVKSIEERLNECQNNTELAMTYKSLTKEEQKKYAKLVGELKAKHAANEKEGK